MTTEEHPFVALRERADRAARDYRKPLFWSYMVVLFNCGLALRDCLMAFALWDYWPLAAVNIFATVFILAFVYFFTIRITLRKSLSQYRKWIAIRDCCDNLATVKNRSQFQLHRDQMEAALEKLMEA